MPDINTWASDAGKARLWLEDIENIARDLHMIHRFITDKPTTIVAYRNSEALDPQIVRIEQTRIQPDVNIGPAAREPRANVILIGYKDHPTIADTDLLPGDKFIADSKKFEVRIIFTSTPGMLQAWLEQTS
jgi:hypothetical protein